MAKQSVMDMLKKPVSHPPKPEGPRQPLVDTMMSRLATDAMEQAIAHLQPKLDAAEHRADAAESLAKAAEMERDALKARISSLQTRDNELTQKIAKECAAKDSANAAYDSERNKARMLEAQVSELSGQLKQLEKHNASLQTNINSITAEIGKKKPEPVKPAVKIPQFNFEVVSRDLNGGIKTVSITPK